MPRISTAPTCPKQSKHQKEIEYRVLFNKQRGPAKEAGGKGTPSARLHLEESACLFHRRFWRLIGSHVKEADYSKWKQSTHGGIKGETLVLGSFACPLPPVLTLKCLLLVLRREGFLHASSHGPFFPKHTHSFYIVTANADRLWSIFS